MTEGMKVSMSNAKRRLLLLLLFGLMILVSAGILWSMALNRRDGLVAGFCFGFGVWAVILPLRTASSQRTAYLAITQDRANSSIFKSRVISLDEEGVRTHYADGAQTSFTWNVVIGWQENSEGFMLHMSRIMFVWVTKSALDSEGTAFLRLKLASIPQISALPQKAAGH